MKEEQLTEVTTTQEVNARNVYKAKEYNSLHLYCGHIDSNTFPFDKLSDIFLILLGSIPIKLKMSPNRIQFVNP